MLHELFSINCSDDQLYQPNIDWLGNSCLEITLAACLKGEYPADISCFPTYAQDLTVSLLYHL